MDMRWKDEHIVPEKIKNSVIPDLEMGFGPFEIHKSVDWNLLLGVAKGLTRLFNERQDANPIK